MPSKAPAEHCRSLGLRQAQRPSRASCRASSWSRSQRSPVGDSTVIRSVEIPARASCTTRLQGAFAPRRVHSDRGLEGALGGVVRGLVKLQGSPYAFLGSSVSQVLTA